MKSFPIPTLEVTVLRLSVLLVSLAAALGLDSLDTGQSGILTVLANLGAVLSLVIFGVVFYGTVSDLRHTLQGDGVRISVNYYFSRPDARLSFVLLPGMLNRGEVVYEQYVDRFRHYGDVLVINWPRYGFDGPAITKRIYEEMMEQNMINPIFVGQSLGSLVAMDVMRYYLEQDSPLGPIQGFLGDSAFTGVRDAKLPAPAWVASLIRDLPFQSLYWPAIAKAQSKSAVERMKPLTEPEVPARLLQLHHYELNHASFHSVAAQGRYIVGFRPPPSAVFEGIPATFLQTPNPTGPGSGLEPGDVLLHERQAEQHLAQLFPDSMFINVGGIHANAVERPAEHWREYEAFIVSAELHLR